MLFTYSPITSIELTGRKEKFVTHLFLAQFGLECQVAFHVIKFRGVRWSSSYLKNL